MYIHVVILFEIKIRKKKKKYSIREVNVKGQWSVTDKIQFHLYQ